MYTIHLVLYILPEQYDKNWLSFFIGHVSL